MPAASPPSAPACWPLCFRSPEAAHDALPGSARSVAGAIGAVRLRPPRQRRGRGGLRQLRRPPHPAGGNWPDDGVRSHAGADADGPPTGTAPAPGSLEALVAALAQQLCGGSPAVIPPDPPSGGEAAVGQPAGPPPAVAQAVAPAVTPHPVPDAAGVPITAAGS